MAACWGRISILKEPAQIGHSPLSWSPLLWAWGRCCFFCLALAVSLLFGRELELDTGLWCCTFLLFILPTSFSEFCSSALGSALSGGLEPDSAWLFFGLATLTGGTLRAAESTMWAERPRVPGCICVRIFLSSEISLVSLQGKRVLGST